MGHLRVSYANETGHHGFFETHPEKGDARNSKNRQTDKEMLKYFCCADIVKSGNTEKNLGVAYSNLLNLL